MDIITIPPVSEYSRADDKLEGCSSDKEYGQLVERWNSQLEKDPSTRRCEYFGLSMLRCLYHVRVRRIVIAHHT